MILMRYPAAREARKVVAELAVAVAVVVVAAQAASILTQARAGLRDPRERLGRTVCKASTASRGSSNTFQRLEQCNPN
jgi:hypothetical protein